jgi:hypothetical protein
MTMEEAIPLVVADHDRGFQCEECHTDEEVIAHVQEALCLPGERVTGAWAYEPYGEPDLDAAYITVIGHDL